MADRAFITPKVFRWARESARMKVETAAAKVAVPVEKLTEWEEGVGQPTIRQAQTLAKAYKRPFALFFLPDVPHDFLPLQDFRKPGAKTLTTSSVFIIREIQQKQAWISEVLAENSEQELRFVGRYSLTDAPQKVARDILATLNLQPGRYPSGKPMREWVEAAEAAGIFVSRASFIHIRQKLDADELQGFAIADRYAPFVFINADDWDAPQLFTLLHELAHIWIAETGISADVEPVSKHKDKYHPVELFCNEVAAHALMPAEMVKAFGTAAFKTYESVFQTARGLGVSSFALLVRALSLDLISLPAYQQLKKAADRAFAEYVQKEAEKKAAQKAKEQPGGPDPYLLRLNRNSRLFTQTVLDAFRGGAIEPTLASSLLNVQVNKFSKLENHLYR